MKKYLILSMAIISVLILTTNVCAQGAGSAAGRGGQQAVNSPQGGPPAQGVPPQGGPPAPGGQQTGGMGPPGGGMGPPGGGMGPGGPMGNVEPPIKGGFEWID